MGKVTIDEETLNEIGSAIITKGGASAPLKPSEMAAAIVAIQSGEELPLYAPAMFPDEKMTPPEWFEDGKVHLWVDFGLNPSDDTIGLRIGANSVGCVEVDWGDGTVEANTEVYDYGINMSHVFDKYANGNEFVITISLKNGVTATRYGYAGVPFVNVGGECAWAVEITYYGGDQGGGGDGNNDTSICLSSGLRYLKVSGNSFKGAYTEEKTTLIRDIITNVYTGTRNTNFIYCLPITRKPDWLEFRGTLGFNSFAGCRNLQKLDESDFRGIAFTNCFGMFRNCSSLVRVPDTLDLSACTNCSRMFQSCVSLIRVPDTLNLSSCTNCSGMFQSCVSLVRVPDTLDLSSCTNCSGMFQYCSSLIRVPDTLNLSSCTNCSSMFGTCTSLIRVPDTLDLSSCTNCSGMFNGCKSLVALPTHVTAIRGLFFSGSKLVSKDSVATFDENGNVVGGFVGNLNTKPSDAGTQTIAFHADTKALFTDNEWTAVKTCLTDKGWAVTPA